MDILDLPADLKQRLRDGIVNIVAQQAEKVTGEKTARVIRQLSSQAAFYNAFDKAMVSALERFRTAYTSVDEDLVEAVITDGVFWQSKDVRQALMTMINRPGSWLVSERETVIQHFVDVLPKRINRKRVDKTVTFFLCCVLEELWTLPGVSEIREIYSLQFQKLSTEAAHRQAALLEAHLQATTQLSADVREALLHLATTLEQRVLALPPSQPALPNAHPYHNLFQPDYSRFIGRQKELDWLRRRLSPSDRAWQIVIAGIGGVGKSALALALADDYRERYNELPPEERFEAIIWVSAKEEVLTITGREKSAPAGLIFSTLEDMYTTIAQTLEREDITRALPEERDHLVQKALSTQRTLLIVDNLEGVTDEKVRTFLYKLPVSTKCIITSREWLDVAAVLKLTGLTSEEADHLITEEATAREVKLNVLEREQLFKRTAGLPLPIKLSVARMASSETFDQVIRWLGNATGDLPEYCVKGQIEIARQRDSNAWKLLLACSLFDQYAGASREALGFSADLALADRDDGLTLLQRLCLLNRDDGDRFWMLPMVQGYAGAELTRADFYESLTETWLSWLLRFAQEHGLDLELHIEKAQRVGAEYPHLLSAFRWCREHDRWETLIRLVEGTCFYPYLVGLFSEFREMLEAAVQVIRIRHDEQNERFEGRFMRQLARPFRVQGEYEKALEYLAKAEEIARRYEEEVELGRAAYIRSTILSKQGHLLEAEQLVREMLEVGERLNSLELKASAAYRFSEFEAKKLAFDKSLQWLEQGDQWCGELGWKRQLAWNLYLQGTILLMRRDTTASEQSLMQSLDMATSWSERRLMAHNKHRLAQVYADTGRLQLALQTAEEARDLCERLGVAVELAEVEELLRTLPGKNGNE